VLLFLGFLNGGVHVTCEPVNYYIKGNAHNLCSSNPFSGRKALISKNVTFKKNTLDLHAFTVKLSLIDFKYKSTYRILYVA
jgi:hypothetical protein